MYFKQRLSSWFDSYDIYDGMTMIITGGTLTEAEKPKDSLNDGGD